MPSITKEIGGQIRETVKELPDQTSKRNFLYALLGYELPKKDEPKK